jgi:hypothetical protein
MEGLCRSSGDINRLMMMMMMIMTSEMDIGYFLLQKYSQRGALSKMITKLTSKIIYQEQSDKTYDLLGPTRQV